MAKKTALGFGYQPQESQHHFLVIIPAGSQQRIAVYERFAWDDDDIQITDITEKNLKVTIDKHKWEGIKTAVTENFNTRLKDRNTVIGKFKIGQVPVERLFGKELVLLLWAIEDSDPKLIPVAIKNWSGLSREERWWLFTMTNAVTGHADDKRGWRKAVRFALTENPIDDDHKQGNILETLYRNM